MCACECACSCYCFLIVVRGLQVRVRVWCVCGGDCLFNDSHTGNNRAVEGRLFLQDPTIDIEKFRTYQSFLEEKELKGGGVREIMWLDQRSSAGAKNYF